MLDIRRCLRWERLVRFEVVWGIAVTGVCVSYAVIEDPDLRRTMVGWIWLAFAVACACLSGFWLIAMQSEGLKTYVGAPMMAGWPIYDIVMTIVCLILRRG